MKVFQFAIILSRLINALSNNPIENVKIAPISADLEFNFAHNSIRRKSHPHA